MRHAGRHQLVVLAPLSESPPPRASSFRLFTPRISRGSSSVTVSTVEPAVAVDPARDPAGSTRPARSPIRSARSASNSGAEVERVDAAVDLADRALVRRGVLVLDDRAQSVRSSRTMRPYPAGVGTTAVRTVAAAPVRSWRPDERVQRARRAAAGRRRTAARACRVAPRSAGSACSRAWPVPSCGSCTAKRQARPFRERVLQRPRPGGRRR